MVDVPANPTISGKIAYYKRPEPLTVQAHGHLGVRRNEHPLSFARESHIVPVTVGEIGHASLHYPIIFVGEPKTPVAVMGLREGQNVFIAPDGKVDPELYLPAYVRRYPFVFAEDKENERFVVCVDAGSEILSEDGEIRLFENGEPTAFTNDAIEFLKSFESQRQVTNQLVELFTKNDLFEVKQVNYQGRKPDGTLEEPQKVAEYYAISSEKMNALPLETLKEFRDNGALAAAYLHLNSLINWQKIIGRVLDPARAPGGAAAIGDPTLAPLGGDGEVKPVEDAAPAKADAADEPAGNA